MKKLLPAILILLSSAALHSQDYKLCDTNRNYYRASSKFFLNKLAVTGILNGTDLVYENPPVYFECKHDFSWMGKKAIHRQNNDFQFLNRDDDTILIKPTLPVGSSWIFHRLSLSDYFEATIVSLDTMSFLGQLDSVKTIHFQYYLAGVASSHPVNSQSIQISKNFGIISSFDFYYFPASITRYDLIGRKNPDIGFAPHTAAEVFDHNINDVLRYEFGEEYEIWNGNILNTNKLFNRRVVNRTETPSHITYQFLEVKFTENLDPEWWNFYSISANTITVTYDLGHYNDSLFERFPNTPTTQALVTNRYDNSYAGFVTRTQEYMEFPSEGCYISDNGAYSETIFSEYMAGMGQTLKSYNRDPIDFAQTYGFSNEQLTGIDQDGIPENDFDNVCDAFGNVLQQQFDLSYSEQNSSLTFVHTGYDDVNTNNLSCVWYLDGQAYDTTAFSGASFIDEPGNYSLKIRFGDYCEFDNMGSDEISCSDLTINSLISEDNNVLTAVNSHDAYQWFDCETDAIIPGETSQVFTPLANGSYALIGTSNSCTDTSDCLVISNVGLSKNDRQHVEFYPNPSNRELFLKTDLAGEARYIIVNSLGQKIQEDRILFEGNEISIDISRLESGAYRLLLEHDSLKTQRFFVKID